MGEGGRNFSTDQKDGQQWMRCGLGSVNMLVER